MNNGMKICVIGEIGSGKSTLVKYIADYTGYPVISFGGIIKDFLVKNGLEITRKNVQNFGQKLIDDHGYYDFLQWLISNSRQIHWDKPLIIDGLRHGQVYSHLAGMFPANVLIYCDCDPDLQMKRIVSRDKISEEEARQILTHKTEQYIQELKTKVHLIFRPEDSVQDFLMLLDRLIR